MLILGIDPGTRIIGYGLISTGGETSPKGGQTDLPAAPGTAQAGPKTSAFGETSPSGVKVIDYGVIKTQDALPRKSKIQNLKSEIVSDATTLSTRLLRSYQQILKIIKEFQPDQMAIETVFFSMDAQATIKIGEARGVALLAAATTSTPVYEYSPAEIKKSVTGNGRADKVQVAEMVKNILSLKEIPKPYDASDALAIAICHTHRIM